MCDRYKIVCPVLKAWCLQGCERYCVRAAIKKSARAAKGESVARAKRVVNQEDERRDDVVESER